VCVVAPAPACSGSRHALRGPQLGAKLTESNLSRTVRLNSLPSTICLRKELFTQPGALGVWLRGIWRHPTNTTGFGGLLKEAAQQQLQNIT